MRFKVSKKSRSEKISGLRQQKNEEARNKNKERKMTKKEVENVAASTAP